MGKQPFLRVERKSGVRLAKDLDRLVTEAFEAGSSGGMAQQCPRPVRGDDLPARSDANEWRIARVADTDECILDRLPVLADDLGDGLVVGLGPSPRPTRTSGARSRPRSPCAHGGLLRGGAASSGSRRNDARLRRARPASRSALVKLTEAFWIRTSRATPRSRGPSSITSPRNGVVPAASGTITRCPIPTAVAVYGSSKYGMRTPGWDASDRRSHPRGDVAIKALFGASFDVSNDAAMNAVASSFDVARTKMTEGGELFTPVHKPAAAPFDQRGATRAEEAVRSVDGIGSTTG